MSYNTISEMVPRCIYEDDPQAFQIVYTHQKMKKGI